MKRKTISAVCMVALATIISACGAKDSAENSVEEVVTQAENDDEIIVDEVVEAVEELNEADAAKLKYEAFLAGEEKVYVDKYDYVKRTEDGDYSYFGDYSCMTIEEFFKQVVDTEKLGSFSFPFESAKYAYIDCGMDGIPELAMEAVFVDEWDQLERYYVIKLVDDKLELTYMDASYYRSFMNITNLAGVVEKVASYGAASSGYQLGFLDADARYVLDYDQEISYMALYMLPGRFDDAVANTEEDYSTLYLRRYAFELNIDGHEFDEYEKRTLYCAQKEADEESNGVDFKENERIAKTLFNYVGDKLYSLDEINNKIAEREKSIGFNDDIKNAGEFGWTDLELDSEYINGMDDAATRAEETSVEYLYIDSLDCFRWEGPLHLYIKGYDGTMYHMSDTTIIASGIPCNDDECDPLIWAARYIEHCPITDESDSNGPYYCLGFGGTEVWEIRADENNNIKSVVDIYAAD